MSKAGIQSNRGDGYQTLVAFDWALTVLTDPDYAWVEVDSTNYDVDDVVIGKMDGSIFCCQCKKNQTEHRAWSFTDLKEELAKAIHLLNSEKADVYFYSRTAFGDVSALWEYSKNYSNPSDYQANLAKKHNKIDSNLAALLIEGNSSLSPYQFLESITFEISPDLARMQQLLMERLRQLVSNHEAAYYALWTQLDHLGMRENTEGQSTAIRHRLTKADLKAILDRSGSILAPPRNIQEICVSFQSTSAIGRSWRRDIGNEHLASPTVDELIAAIIDKQRSILLTGQPGSGKTCVMLSVQERLEELAKSHSNLQPLFIQSREFANLANAQDRHAHGLPEDWVESAARMAESAHVVVIIDSLDVLSIARDHRVLDYFLAQIDRLLLIPNITVVTACRDFDRHYDRRIAQRVWEKIISCQPLDWNTEISPLLTRLDIDTSFPDGTTRELIRNPRELALFVELAQRDGCFNVVTSQALAQRYLYTIVQSDSSLGEPAMQAIEVIANEMLKLRSLTVPQQRFPASQEIQRSLLSSKVLHQTEDGQLTFGHQTLFDVLVISGAVRQGMTLNSFIQQLPPVPFVRPSIRSFVAQLAIRERPEYRKQLRTVLTGRHAFHIRRLVAEAFAESIPQDGDWPLIRDLHNQHREVFQVIYTKATQVEWHHFWMKYLVPQLRDSSDIDGLVRHAYLVSQYKNDDPEGVSAYWSEQLSQDALTKGQSIPLMASSLEKIDPEHVMLYTPVLRKLLHLPWQPHSFLGYALAHFLKHGAACDIELWDYIAGDITDDDLIGFRLGNLHCEPYEFGKNDNKFLEERMRNSPILLDLAIATIERWSQNLTALAGDSPRGYRSNFLHITSQDKADHISRRQHPDSELILMDAIEAAIVHHAISQSVWWQNNHDRLCFNTEGALRYFAIVACTTAPTSNLDIIAQLLCDRALLNSDFSYEFGTLMHVAFIHMDEKVQDTIQVNIQAFHQENIATPQSPEWMLHRLVLFILAIPCHLRCSNLQAILASREKVIWPLIREEDLRPRGGFVRAPFSFSVFFDTSDDGVLRLLSHYDGYERYPADDFLVGGKEEVGSELKQAASRNPTRFLTLLSVYWDKVPGYFRDSIMEGMATHLGYLYGHLSPGNEWNSIEQPEAKGLVQKVLNELEHHPKHWHHKRAAAQALEYCAFVAESAQDTARLVTLAMNFATLQESSAIGSSVNLLTTGINMARGTAAEALMILANQLDKNHLPWPESLPDALRLFVRDENPAIRTVMLQRMPYLQSHHPELGWQLFDLAMQEKTPGLWPMAEYCLYYAYQKNYGIVATWLTHLYKEGVGKELETWGRISALATLPSEMEFSTFLTELKALASNDAWRGAIVVWTNIRNAQEYRKNCFSGLEAGLDSEGKNEVVRQFSKLFRETQRPIAIPFKLIQQCFDLVKTQCDQADFFNFGGWLNASSMRDPIYTLDVANIYLDLVRSTQTRVYDHDNQFTQLLTCLFAQAEEREESDDGAMLRQVVDLQDALITLGVHGVNDWLEAAERP